MMWWLLALGCASENRAPVVDAVNDVAVSAEGGGYVYIAESVPFHPGGTLVMSIDAWDPDDDALQVWVPSAPPGLSWDADRLRGEWVVPAQFADASWTFEIVVADVADAPDPVVVYLEAWRR